jgi:hypothetical protein
MQISIQTGRRSTSGTRRNVLVGVRVGDAVVFVDHVAEESPALSYVARTHAGRPLYTSAAGKALLANLPDEEMYRLLDLPGAERAAEVRLFLAELPEPNRRSHRNHVPLVSWCPGWGSNPHGPGGPGGFKLTIGRVSRCSTMSDHAAEQGVRGIALLTRVRP